MVVEKRQECSMFKFKPSQVRIRSILESIESVEAKTPDGSRRDVRHAPFSFAKADYHLFYSSCPVAELFV